MIPAIYYDIESLKNMFTVACFTDAENPADCRLDLYYLINDDQLVKGSDPAAWRVKQNACLLQSGDRTGEAVKDVPEVPDLSEDQKVMIADRIRKANRNFVGVIRFHNLSRKSEGTALSMLFGVSDARYANDPAQKNTYAFNGTDIHGNQSDDPFRPDCDTDPGWTPEKAPYLMGYNSYNYDTTMLAKYFSIVWSADPNKDKKEMPIWRGTTADEMRDFNDLLFRQKDAMPKALTNQYDDDNSYNTNAWKIRKNMLMSGRNIDVARLNEKQSKVGLKRLLGMLGCQILESDRLGQNAEAMTTDDQLADLIAYNASDVFNLKTLFMSPQYQGQFELKSQLLETYPEMRYGNSREILPEDFVETPGEPRPDYRPEIAPDNVRRDRNCVDSSSAQFSTKALCPYENTTVQCKNGRTKPMDFRTEDSEYVSFMYPDEKEYEIQKKAYESGESDLPPVKPFDVLENTKAYFDENFADFPELRARFDVIYKFYSWIRGKNFDDAAAYADRFHPGDFTKDPGDKHHIYSLKDIPAAIKAHPEDFAGKAYDKDGKLYEIPYDMYGTCIPYYTKDGEPTSAFALFSTGGIHGAEYNKELYNNDTAVWEAEKAEMETVQDMFGNDAVACRKARKFTLPDGTETDYSKYLKSGRKIDDSEWRDIEAKRPKLFTEDKKGYSLNKKYVYTSVGKANHEDFVSYYPWLMVMLQIFYNEGLNIDRLIEIFNQKSLFGKEMKDMTKTPEEREHFRVMREGTKLILNSASGAADARFDNSIRANNRIIAMRCIGQLFSWRIGQAETLAGAVVPSTNTDGLYTFLDDEELNADVLKRETSKIHIQIDAEPVMLVSKDSNNRLELSVKDGSVLSASGGTLGCRKGPSMTKALSHPAVIDWALTEYLACCANHHKDLSIDKPFDNDIGMHIIERAAGMDDTTGPVFDPVQTLLMFQNIIASSPGMHAYIYATEDGNPEPINLQQYNRMFIMKDGTPGCVHLQTATARKVTPAMKKKRDRAGDTSIVEPAAKKILKANGEDVEELRSGNSRDIITKKCTGIDPEWDIMIENGDLSLIEQKRYEEIMNGLDLDRYLSMVRSAYENNWRNHRPGDTDVNPDGEEDAEEYGEDGEEEDA